MMNRRSFLYSAAAAALPQGKYRAAIIGHTGHGNYGHDWDRSFRGFQNIEVVAIADPDDAGRAKAKARSGAARDYRDYREMLQHEKPNVVAICPRWLDERVAMVTAAAAAGAHILLEKPFAATLEDADVLVDTAERARIKVQVGHTARPHPITLQVNRMVQEGAIGRLMEMRARGKEDRRAGASRPPMRASPPSLLAPCLATTWPPSSVSPAEFAATSIPKPARCPTMDASASRSTAARAP